MKNQQTVTGSLLKETRILLAEDNAINQKVALGMLNRLGYRADLAVNGFEAVRALERIDYDLVLMDCQMPKLDGFEATAMIRGHGSNVLNHAVPIIAMTANGMKGDREKCLEAGMDDYLAKPVIIDELDKILAVWLVNSRAHDKAASADPAETLSGSGRMIFDEADMLERLEDRAFMHSILKDSLQDLPEQLQVLQSLCAGGDCAVIRRQAHTLKGVASTISAYALHDIVLRIEAAAHEGALQAVRELLPEVERQVQATREAIRTFCEGRTGI